VSASDVHIGLEDQATLESSHRSIKVPMDMVRS
jgi:hypothetical protein